MIKNEPGMRGFWNGFLAGGALASIILYIFGTKKGRKGLQTLLSFSENLEENIHKIAHYSTTSNTKKMAKNQRSLLDAVATILDKIQYASKRA